ncbi:MAG: hypothetical protein O7D34_03235 [Ignavibacteria bacterium]|nr:hypothetical protein [Ignavibacteria bacterium]
MKTIVYEGDFEELEIKPKAALEQYCKLMDHEVSTRMTKSSALITRKCPGCHSKTGHPVFEKSGLTYIECGPCKSVYISPCPSDDALTEFYRNSESVRFWRGSLWEDTREVRRRKVYGPLAEWTLDTLDRYFPKARISIDVGYHSQLLLKELMSEKGPITKIIVTNPVADIECAGIDLEGVQVVPTGLANISQHGPVDVVLAFDILPCVADVDALFAAARAGLVSGGLLFLNTISISGFDLQILWEHSPTIYPPDRMNLLSVEGLEELFERHGFEILEFSTPGMFDVDIVKRVLQKDAELPCPRFIRYLLMKRGEQALREFQEYLQQYRLSSYTRVALRKS